MGNEHMLAIEELSDLGNQLSQDVDNLIKIEDIIKDNDELSPTAAQITEIALEEIRLALDVKNTKISTEALASPQKAAELALEASSNIISKAFNYIYEIIKKIWNSIVSFFTGKETIVDTDVLKKEIIETAKESKEISLVRGKDEEKAKSEAVEALFSEIKQNNAEISYLKTSHSPDTVPTVFDLVAFVWTGKSEIHPEDIREIVKNQKVLVTELDSYIQNFKKFAAEAEADVRELEKTGSISSFNSVKWLEPGAIFQTSSLHGRSAFGNKETNELLKFASDSDPAFDPTSATIIGPFVNGDYTVVGYSNTAKTNIDVYRLDYEALHDDKTNYVDTTGNKGLEIIHGLLEDYVKTFAKVKSDATQTAKQVEDTLKVFKAINDKKFSGEADMPGSIRSQLNFILAGLQRSSTLIAHMSKQLQLTETRLASIVKRQTTAVNSVNKKLKKAISQAKKSA